MAKTSMRPEVKAQKMKNNKAPILICHTKDCENEFYVATFNNLGQAKRHCQECYDVKPESKADKDAKLLARLGLAA